MEIIGKSWRKRAMGMCLLASCAWASSPAVAAPVLTTVNANLLTAPFTFSFMGSSFTFFGQNTFPDFIAVSTGGGAAVRTVFGNPSTDFTNRGTVIYDANTLGGYGAFPSRTTVPTTNGDNFLGLRVMSGGQNYYGFAYTTNAVLNGYGFETTPNAGITATTAFPAAAAVPEPATWAAMLLGFGLVGAALRRRRHRTVLA